MEYLKPVAFIFLALLSTCGISMLLVKKIINQYIFTFLILITIAIGIVFIYFDRIEKISIGVQRVEVVLNKINETKNKFDNRVDEIIKSLNEVIIYNAVNRDVWLDESGPRPEDMFRALELTKKMEDLSQNKIDSGKTVNFIINRSIFYYIGKISSNIYDNSEIFKLTSNDEQEKIRKKINEYSTYFFNSKDVINVEKVNSFINFIKSTNIEINIYSEHVDKIYELINNRKL